MQARELHRLRRLLLRELQLQHMARRHAAAQHHGSACNRHPELLLWLLLRLLHSHVHDASAAAGMRHEHGGAVAQADRAGWHRQCGALLQHAAVLLWHKHHHLLLLVLLGWTLHHRHHHPGAMA